MFREVTSALDQIIASLPDAPPIAFPNVNFTPPDGLYLAVMNMPADGVMYNFSRAQNTPGVYRIMFMRHLTKAQQKPRVWLTASLDTLGQTASLSRNCSSKRLTSLQQYPQTQSTFFRSA